MKVKTTTWGGREHIEELSSFLTPSNDPYENGGALEDAQALARKNAEAVGRTLALLVEKEVIDFDEAKTAAGIYDNGELIE